MTTQQSCRVSMSRDGADDSSTVVAGWTQCACFAFASLRLTAPVCLSLCPLDVCARHRPRTAQPHNSDRSSSTAHASLHCTAACSPRQRFDAEARLFGRRSVTAQRSRSKNSATPISNDAGDMRGLHGSAWHACAGQQQEPPGGEQATVNGNGMRRSNTESFQKECVCLCSCAATSTLRA